MYIEIFTYYLFAVVSTLYIVHMGLYLVGANLYDIWQSNLNKKRRKDLDSGYLLKYEPLMTIIVSARNEEKVIVRCLDSINANTYKNIEVLVVDDFSSDHTLQLVRNYKRNHRELKLRVLFKLKNVGKGTALNHALRHYASGELVMTIDADSVIAKDAISNAVMYFGDSRIVGVAANVKTFDDFTILGTLQKLEYMVGYRSKKVYSIANCEFVIGGVASTYRMSVLKEVGFYTVGTMTEDIGLSIKIANLGNRTHRLIYGSNIVATTESVNKFKVLLRQRYRWKYGSLQNIFRYRHLIAGRNVFDYTATLNYYRLPFAILSEILLLFVPFIWSYVLFWTIEQRSLLLIFGAYVTITAYIFITICFDENSTYIEKLRLCLYAPIGYFLFFIMDIVQIIAVLRCSSNSRKLFRNEDAVDRWISPARLGKNVTIG